MAVPAKIWTNSGDSHCIEPPEPYRDNMPAHYAERMPRSEFVDGDIITYIDGKVIKRRAPGGANLEMMEAMRAQGGTDNSKRMADLDEQGVWGEVVFPSLGLWYGEMESADLATAAAEVLNDWVRRRDHARCRTGSCRARRCRCSRSSSPSPRWSAASAKGFKVDLPADEAARDARPLERRRVGAAVGRDRGHRLRARVPHRHRVPARSRRSTRAPAAR